MKLKIKRMDKIWIEKNVKYRKINIANNIVIWEFFCQKFNVNWTNTCQIFVKHLATLSAGKGAKHAVGLNV